MNITYSELVAPDSLPLTLRAALSSQDWPGMIRALDDGLPVGMVMSNGQSLFEGVLGQMESVLGPCSVSHQDMQQAPLEVLEAFVRNGLSPLPAGPGGVTAVAICVAHGQWTWADYLLDRGFPSEAENGSVLLALLEGRFQRWVKAASGPDFEEQPDPRSLSETEPEPDIPSNVTRFPGSRRSPPSASVIRLDFSLPPPPNGTPEEQSRIRELVCRLALDGARLEARIQSEDDSSGLLGLTPLMAAIIIMDIPCVVALIEAGADVATRPEGLSQSPLEMAISRGSLPIVSLLVEAGAAQDLDRSLPFAKAIQNQPLVLASRLGLPNLIPVLFGALSEKNKKSFGMPAMHFAASAGYVPVMEALNRCGIDYSIPTRVNGFHPIHQSAYCGRISALEFLLEQGCSFSDTTESGVSAEDILRSHHPELLSHFKLNNQSNVHVLLPLKKPKA